MMNLLEHLHERVVVPRRRAVLARHVAAVIPQGVHVLDVGCGDGTLTREIMDLRPDLTVEGMEVLCRSQGGFPVTAYDGRKLPCENQAVDVVLFIDVLHHAEDPLGLLKEACRVSRRAIVIKDHLLDGLLAGPTLRLMDWIGNRRHGVALPYNYWSRAEWDAAFESCGLEVNCRVDALSLYSRPAAWVFERRLHFLAKLTLRAFGETG